jgi:hypothetical protein
MKPCYRVNLIVDEHFGAKLLDLPQNEPVWIVDLPGNAHGIKTARMFRVGNNHLTGITSFQAEPTSDPRNHIIEMLPTIEEHHGIYSHNPPFDALRIFGFADADSIEDECRKIGFDLYERTDTYVEFTRK